MARENMGQGGEGQGHRSSRKGKGKLKKKARNVHHFQKFEKDVSHMYTRKNQKRRSAASLNDLTRVSFHERGRTWEEDQNHPTIVQSGPDLRVLKNERHGSPFRTIEKRLGEPTQHDDYPDKRGGGGGGGKKKGVPNKPLVRTRIPRSYWRTVSFRQNERNVKQFERRESPSEAG